MLLTAALIAACLLGLSGCGGSSDNGVADKSAQEILQASKAAATSASSVHVVGKTSQGPITLTTDLKPGKDQGRAKVSFLGAPFEVIRIGETVYVKGSSELHKQLLGPTAHVPQGTWLKGPASGGPAQLAAFTDLPGELNRLLSTPGSVTKGAMTKVNGQKVIELKETTKVYKGALYVATTGKPYPVQLVKTGGKERGAVSFSEWDKAVSLTAPSPVVEISSLKG